ncbi:hypothetical protein [Aurantibacillus circumpalustris]|uniref:hypothetical protein n=1 Tax=Aurantibacillus circumpalustris TaxID=3036359 RepID=UPI00295AC21A|nr:hypothetical protein [Aurantibacillus circumpalustris]
MTKYSKTIIFFLLIYGQTFSQTCEKFDRKLFHSLPDNFPDSINCKDKFAKKQGWWIYYKVQYNPVDKPDELEKGDYVQDYFYGQYADDRKIGTWHTVMNVHLIYDQREDSYYYSQDTSRVTSWFADGGFNESDILYIKDSTIIKSTSLAAKEKYPICIDCDKKNKICIMTYRNETIKKFPFDSFGTEFEKTFFMYDRDKKSIDKKQQ